jgi:8-oxo-dGTP pyrophosphatase MutT (NUDIX family)
MTIAMNLMNGAAAATKPGAPVWKARAYTGAGIILTRLDGVVPRFLCLRGRQSGIWSFSKGHPETVDNRMPLRTAVRETQEETGFVAGVDYKIIGASVRFGKRPYWMGILGANVANRLVVARREHDVAAWFTYDEIVNLGTKGNTDVRAWARKAPGAFMPTLETASVAVARAQPKH